MRRRLGSAALGGLPLAAASATRGRAGRSTVRQVPPRTSRDMLMGLLRRKAWQLRDLEHHPACLGVPLGQDGGAAKGVSVDLGLKTMATVSLTDLVDASPHFKQALIERGLTDAQEAKAAELQGAAEGQGAAELQGAEEGGAAGGAAGEAADAEAGGAEARATEPLAYADLMRRAQPVPMLVAVKEDLMKQPIASPIHPAALERSIPESECFFWRAHQPRTCLSPPCLALTPPSRHLLHRQAAHPQRRLLSRRAARRRIGRPRCRGGARRRPARGGARRLSEGAAHRPAHRARRQRRQGLTDVDGMTGLDVRVPTAVRLHRACRHPTRTMNE